MKSKNSARIVMFLLKRSPRSQAKNMNKVLRFNQVSLDKVKSDEAYVAQIIQQIQCQDMFPSPFSWGRNHERRQQSNQQHSSKKKQITKNEQLLQTIKQLQKSNPMLNKFIQAEQLIVLMSAQQAQEMKKKLMYLYKLVLKNKDRYSPIHQELADTLVKSIVKKIYVGSQEEQQKSRKFRVQKVIKQLLVEARERHDIGDIKVARQFYEEIFRNQEAQQTVKIQALQFLCIKSCEKGDLRYLSKIAQQVKQKGNKKHEQFVNQFLQSMKSKVRQLD